MKNSTLKLFASAVFMMMMYVVNAQSHTICTGEVREYAVDLADSAEGTPGSTYVWTITPVAPAVYGGAQTNVTATGNHIEIDWDTSTVGSYTLSVVETSADGCITDPPVTFTVIITEGPDVTLVEANESPICDLEDALFNITGTPGATVTYSFDGGTTTATVVLDGTGNEQVDASGAPVVGGTITITIISVANGTCVNSTNITDDTATITVNAAPTTSPIQAL
ncbi:MAG: hypothetical protein WCY25_06610 [Moheibacter sp.]